MGVVRGVSREPWHEGQDQQSSCVPVPQVVGSGVQESEPFKSTGPSFRVIEPFEGAENGFVVYVPLGQSGQPVLDSYVEELAPDSIPSSYEDSIRFTSGRGIYSLSIGSQNGEYSYLVEDCPAPGNPQSSPFGKDGSFDVQNFASQSGKPSRSQSSNAPRVVGEATAT